MAMVHSNELAETVAVMFEQFKALGEEPERMAIEIVNEKKHVFDIWATQHGGSQLNSLAKISLDEPHVMQKMYKAWKAKKRSITIDLQGKELNDYFNGFGFTYVPDDVLTTTVANLMMWYIRTNSLQLPIEKLLPEIFKTNKSSLGGWQENSYEFQDSEYFDETSFNNYTGRKLDEIIEKIEDGADDDFNARDYVDMVDRISKKIEIGRWYDLPKNKKVRFKIENFEMNPNKIVVKLSKDLKQRTLKLSEENFYYLLYQPTLFNLEEI
jgi:hypothetical protein